MRAQRDKKRAKDGTLRGRPPLFGTAGEYERLYAEVRPKTAVRLRTDASSSGCSVSHLVCAIVSAHRPESFRTRPPRFQDQENLPEERVYAQIPGAVGDRLKEEAREHGWAVSRVLAAIIDEHYAVQPGLRAAN